MFLRYITYLILCLFIMFLDFHYKSRGLLTLSFDIVFSSFIVLNLDFKSRLKIFKLNCNYFLLNAIIIIILFSILKETLVRYFYVYPVDYYENIDVYFMVSILVKSFTEEIIFRGYWLNYFSEKINFRKSIFLVSFGFGVLHLFARNNPIYAFICSVYLSYIYLNKKSISYTYIIHLFNNLFIIFVMPHFIAGYSNLEAWNKIKDIIIVFLALIFFLKYLFKKDDNEK